MSYKAYLKRLVAEEVKQGRLPDEVLNNPILKALGVAPFVAGDETGGTSGIASPLTEFSRETVDIEVFDDFNVWSVTETHTIVLTMTDADNRTVIFNFTNPAAP